MTNKIFFAVFILTLFLLTNITNVFAIAETNKCNPMDFESNHGCDAGLLCKPTAANPNITSCEKPARAAGIQDIFGKITPPPALKNLLKDDQTGAGAISTFLSNGITLIYSIAAIVLLFMFLWGAFQWLTSGGDKEQLAAAQKRIINAIIGIILFAVAFAVIAVLGQFTGFTFFKGQGT